MIETLDPWIKTLLLVVAAKIRHDGPITIGYDSMSEVATSDIVKLKTDSNHQAGTVTISLGDD